MKYVSIKSKFILVVWLCLVECQDVPCTTPVKKSGLCVDIQQCRNIHRIVSSTSPPSRGLANYIRRAACELPGVSRSVCCEPQEVALSSTSVTPPTSTTTPRSSSSCSPTAVAESRVNLLSQDCGKSVSERLSHGNVTRVFAYPWMALIRYKQNGKIIDGCGGSLINERYVLTAAHCIKTSSNRKLHSVILGEHTKGQDIDCNVYHNERGIEIDRDCADAAEEFGIESFEYHADYNRPKFSNDIGLLRLDRDVTMKDHIRPLCLPVTSDLRQQTFDRYILTGWGTTENGTPSDVLLEAILPRVDNQECRRKLNQRRLNINLGSKQMCAGGKNLVDACRGDSGGPLGTYANYRGVRFVQYGIVTTGVSSCGQSNVPGVYCRVADYVDWIMDKIQPRC